MQENEKYEYDFTVGWTRALLDGINDNSNNTYASFEKCACFHYSANNMEDIIKKYVGNPDGFLNFLSEAWGWKINKSDDTGKIIIDEGKNFCVCPVVHRMENNVPPVICNCSEHFAQKMFSAVVGNQVNVKVIRSFVRDGKSCIYEITL